MYSGYALVFNHSLQKTQIVVEKYHLFWSEQPDGFWLCQWFHIENQPVNMLQVIMRLLPTTNSEANLDIWPSSLNDH